MQVKQRLQLNAALSVIAAAAVILVLILSMYRVIRAVEASDIAGRIITADFERLTLRNDYVQSGSERARAQWLSKNEGDRPASHIGSRKSSGPPRTK